MRAWNTHRLAARLATALLPSLVAFPASAAELVAGLGGPAGFGANRLPLGVHSTCALVPGGPETPGPIDVTPAFPHGFEYFAVGTSTDGTVLRICINENGTVTMRPDNLGLGPGTPIAFPQATPMYAPFWGDVDTSGATLANPDVDAIYWDLRPNAITITWHNVGYEAAHSDLRNDFQMVVRSYDALCDPSTDIEFRYHRCEWTAGDRSGGIAGHGGVGAEAGFDAADGVHYFAMPGSLDDAVGDLCTTSNVGEPGVWRYRIRPALGSCTGGGTPCDTGRMGLCRDGVGTCHHSNIAVCEAIREATPEVCNGLDDDCDGSTDEGDALCNAGDVCERGECVEVCRDDACPGGERCSAEGGCLDVACLDVTCAGGSVCSGGACVDPCMSVHCPSEQACVGGQCIDPCATVSCGDGTCFRGRCLGPCPCSCPDGYACDGSNRCRPADCIPLECPAGQVCRSSLGTSETMARCVDACDGVVCPRRQHCETGRCVYDPHPPVDAGVSDAGANVSDGTLLDALDEAAVDATADASTSPPGHNRSCACRTGGSGGGRAMSGWVLLFAAFAVGRIRGGRSRHRVE